MITGIHHVTAIAGDPQENLDFYAGVLGMRLVKKSVNQDDPGTYHLFYADEQGSPGADLTFFEYPGALPGRAGAGMVYRVVWRVAGPDAGHVRFIHLGVELQLREILGDLEQSLRLQSGNDRLPDFHVASDDDTADGRPDVETFH